jgi:hypothetical protein
MGKAAHRMLLYEPWIATSVSAKCAVMVHSRQSSSLSQDRRSGRFLLQFIDERFSLVRFLELTAKYAVFWDVTLCSSCKNRCFGQRIAFTIRVTRMGKLRCVFRLLATANAPSSPIPVTLIMETTRSTETSDLTTATRSHIPEDGILHRHRRENLKSYMTVLHKL